MLNSVSGPRSQTYLPSSGAATSSSNNMKPCAIDGAPKAKIGQHRGQKLKRLFKSRSEVDGQSSVCIVAEAWQRLHYGTVSHSVMRLSFLSFREGQGNVIYLLQLQPSSHEITKHCLLQASKEFSLRTKSKAAEVEAVAADSEAASPKFFPFVPQVHTSSRRHAAVISVAFCLQPSSCIAASSP
jgi:hypothetical protein